ncbi:MAG: Npun_F0296 family exosortase-dependent surface protein [Rhodospirillaceae bacterium]
MKSSRLRSIAAITAFLIGTGVACSAQASFFISAAVGGAPSGVSYVNFDNLALGAAGGTSGGVGVSFASDGQVVNGASTGLYAAPFISNSNGALFGDATVSGVDTTNYITSGVGKVTLTMPGSEKYLGLLWGSVDTFNTLEFFIGSTSVGTVTGADIFAFATGDQGVNGTYYANIVSSLAFDSVVATSTSHAFEIDNVAYNPTSPLPEPISLGLMGFGLLGLGAARRRKAAKA